jgi:hypothetical protein
MPSLERLRTDFERLRTVTALQRMHARHGFARANRSDLALLWRGAHTGGLLHYEASDDPAVLVAIYLEHARRKYRDITRTYASSGASWLAEQNRLIRDSGVQSLPRATAALKRYLDAEGEKPREGWRVPYHGWDPIRHTLLPERLVLLGGGPVALARKANAARAMSSAQLGELPPAEAYLLAVALGVDEARPALDHAGRQELLDQIVGAQHRLPGLENAALIAR